MAASGSQSPALFKMISSVWRGGALTAHAQLHRLIYVDSTTLNWSKTQCVLNNVRLFIGTDAEWHSRHIEKRDKTKITKILLHFSTFKLRTAKHVVSSNNDSLFQQFAHISKFHWQATTFWNQKCRRFRWTRRRAPFLVLLFIIVTRLPSPPPRSHLLRATIH